MAKIRLDIVTAERTVFSDDVDVVVAPGHDGQLGILPRHAPLLTALDPGELLIRRDGQETYMAVSGGFMEVVGNHVIVLADTAERAEEIDAARAEAARQRAVSRLSGAREKEFDIARAAAALRRSQVRLKVARRRRQEAPPQAG
ncbi:MAG: F0F1 ATP synthase subunit epsilon [Chloroflexi bacterium]|nr:F0F1 ATP synthase subunit epsilon [Chloroflexota bacterium]